MSWLRLDDSWSREEIDAKFREALSPDPAASDLSAALAEAPWSVPAAVAECARRECDEAITLPWLDPDYCSGDCRQLAKGGGFGHATTKANLCVDGCTCRGKAAK